MIRQKAIWVAGFIFGQVCLSFGAEPRGDRVFQAMEDELNRSMTLRLEGLDAPYFIQYEVSDSRNYRVSAAYGALLRSDQDRSRTLISQLRVGSETLDNSNFGGRGGGGRSGLGASTPLSIDDNYVAIRQAIWRATDWQFKDALETLTRKQAYLKERNLEDRPPDFSKTNPVVAIKETATLSFDRPAWERYARRISSQCRDFARIQNAEVDLVTGLANRYLLNSEGSRLRDGQTETLLRITLEAQSDDGQWLSDHLSYFAPTPGQLPSEEQVIADLSKLAHRMEEAVAAQVLDDYTGPVLFEGLAATQLFRQLLGSGVTALPDPIGTARRSAQDSDDLDNRVGKRILPATFQVYDDPRKAQFENSFLAGYYQIDDEAVPAERVDIVVDGKLEGMVMSRTPTKRFALSNGHGRRGGTDVPRSALGCLYISSSKGFDAEELKKQLLDTADRDGLKFGLRVGGLQSRSGAAAGGGPGARFRRGGGAGRMVGDPLYLYKVYVADGHEEAVRGCEFTSLDLQSLRKILAAGKERIVQNNVIGATPSSSIIAPPILLGDVELSRIKAEGERKPVLQAPRLRSPQSALGQRQ